MRVAGELQVEAGGLGRRGAARLVREQQPHRRVGRARRRAPPAGSLACGAVEVAGAEVGDAGDDESMRRRGGRRRARSAGRRGRAGAARATHAARAGVVLVVAGDEERALPASAARRAARRASARSRTEPSTRSPVTATRSTSSRFTASTIASTYGRLMVGPTWTSLTCAIVKPSSAAGRPAIGTSTRTTRAVRRALAKPQSVDERGRDRHRTRRGRDERARGATAPGQIASTAPAASRRPASRTTVRTNRDENRPMQTRPTQASAAAPRPAPPRPGAEAERQRQRRDEQEHGERDGAGERVEPGNEPPADIGVEKERDRLQAHRGHLGCAGHAFNAGTGAFSTARWPSPSHGHLLDPPCLATMGQGLRVREPPTTTRRQAMLQIRAFARSPRVARPALQPPSKRRPRSRAGPRAARRPTPP